MKQVKIGIIGPGSIAQTFARETAFCQNVMVTAVASRDLVRAKSFAQQFGIAKAYGDYPSLLEDPDIDAVYIATPHNSHFELCKQSLEHGKAVLCEKPMVLTTEEMTILIALAKEQQLLLMEAMWTRCLPTMQKAHEWVNAGLIGELKLLSADFGFHSEVSPQSRLYNKALAGGAMYDVGVYVLSFALDFAGAPLQSFQVMSTEGETDVDETSAFLLQFENGVIANLHCGIRAQTNQTACLYGTKGRIELPTFWGGVQASVWDNQNQLMDEFHSGYQDVSQGFRYEIIHFCDLFRSGALVSARIPHEDQLTYTKIFEARR